ncbi:hypothetical protein JHW43_005244 [Diplocarpon mali]|nr:hypothetical protein JHW43_005244 [Diplocarpon mali]
MKGSQPRYEHELRLCRRSQESNDGCRLGEANEEKKKQDAPYGKKVVRDVETWSSAGEESRGSSTDGMTVCCFLPAIFTASRMSSRDVSHSPLHGSTTLTSDDRILLITSPLPAAQSCGPRQQLTTASSSPAADDSEVGVETRLESTHHHLKWPTAISQDPPRATATLPISDKLPQSNPQVPMIEDSTHSRPEISATPSVRCPGALPQGLGWLLLTGQMHEMLRSLDQSAVRSRETDALCLPRSREKGAGIQKTASQDFPAPRAPSGSTRKSGLTARDYHMTPIITCSDPSQIRAEPSNRDFKWSAWFPTTSTTMTLPPTSPLVAFFPQWPKIQNPNASKDFSDCPRPVRVEAPLSAGDQTEEKKLPSSLVDLTSFAHVSCLPLRRGDDSATPSLACPNVMSNPSGPVALAWPLHHDEAEHMPFLYSRSSHLTPLPRGRTTTPPDPVRPQHPKSTPGRPNPSPHKLALNRSPYDVGFPGVSASYQCPGPSKRPRDAYQSLGSTIDITDVLYERDSPGMGSTEKSPVTRGTVSVSEREASRRRRITGQKWMTDDCRREVGRRLPRSGHSSYVLVMASPDSSRRPSRTYPAASLDTCKIMSDTSHEQLMAERWL